MIVSFSLEFKFSIALSIVSSASFSLIVKSYFKATKLIVSPSADFKFEGFKPLKFQRSGVVLAVCSPLFYFVNDPTHPVSLGFLVYMNGGLERFVVEYYKTYIQRTMSGKFRPDLPRIQKCLDTREKFHYGALVIIVSLIVLYVFEV